MTGMKCFRNETNLPVSRSGVPRSSAGCFHVLWRVSTGSELTVEAFPVSRAIISPGIEGRMERKAGPHLRVLRLHAGGSIAARNFLRGDYATFLIVAFSPNANASIEFRSLNPARITFPDEKMRAVPASPR